MKATITGENKKKIEFEVNALNLDDRGVFNNTYHKAELSDPMDWTSFAKCCLLGTDFDEEKLNELTDIEIILIAKECYLVINKKKVKK
jgi:hypothetical protein|tara:strand:+ start:1076 stop:1339 length:264 start_codon:yes stop_codon:yes gene_type:complete